MTTEVHRLKRQHQHRKQPQQQQQQQQLRAPKYVGSSQKSFVQRRVLTYPRPHPTSPAPLRSGQEQAQELGDGCLYSPPDVSFIPEPMYLPPLNMKRHFRVKTTNVFYMNTSTSINTNPSKIKGPLAATEPAITPTNPHDFRVLSTHAKLKFDLHQCLVLEFQGN